MKTNNSTPLGKMLLSKKLIDEKQLKTALARSNQTGEFVGTALVALGFITEETLYPLLAEQIGIPFIRMKDISVPADLLTAVQPATVHRYEIIPIKREGKAVLIATADPLNVAVLDEIKIVIGSPVRPLLARRSEILQAIKNYYGVGAETLHQMLENDRHVIPMNERPVPAVDQDEEASVIRLVNQILYEGFISRATDIHIEPYEDELSIRYRIDGILYPVPVPADVKCYQDAIISRIKVMASLNIAEKRLPQDGRIQTKIRGGELNLRISILPTSFGEGVQIRILSATIFKLPELGLRSADRELLAQIIKKPYGIIFVTGPTGSGKTTSLYAFLNQLNSSDRKIITIEDPIEYLMKGVTQVQIHPAIGLTFAQGLRSMLRHDPDIMMVGEVRDTETAEIAIRVALTGHLVFSTLHTNDAPAAVTRLLDMGIEPYLISSSVECLIAQRLVRVICPVCKEELAPELAAELRAQHGLAQGPLYRGKGCEKCKHTGYQGRTGIYEILVMNDEIRQMILKRMPANEIRRAAVGAGMRTLRDHGFEKVQEGITTVSEVLKVSQDNEQSE